jgi:cobalt-zinc-cadmium efflux system protein
MRLRPRVLRHQGHAHDFGHGHPHGHEHGPAGGPKSSASRRLLVCFLLTATFMVVEALAGVWTNSLALLSDAFHMLSDAGALGLAAFAARASLRRPTPEKTYGYKRLEVLAAFANALLLAVLGVGVGAKALMRLGNPAPVDAEPMLVVAALGLALNVGIFLWLHLAEGERNLNEEGALWHVLGDALGSIAALVAGFIMLRTGWMRADALAGLFTAVILLFGAQRVLRKSAHILVEGAPEGVDAGALRAAMEAHPGVRAVHDLHLWTLTGRDLYLSAHVEPDPSFETGTVTATLRRELETRFAARHVTLQVGPCDPDCGDACK